MPNTVSTPSSSRARMRAWAPVSVVARWLLPCSVMVTSLGFGPVCPDKAVFGQQKTLGPEGATEGSALACGPGGLQPARWPSTSSRLRAEGICMARTVLPARPVPSSFPAGRLGMRTTISHPGDGGQARKQLRADHLAHHDAALALG